MCWLWKDKDKKNTKLHIATILLVVLTPVLRCALVEDGPKPMHDLDNHSERNDQLQ